MNKNVKIFQSDFYANAATTTHYIIVLELLDNVPQSTYAVKVLNPWQLSSGEYLYIHN